MALDRSVLDVVLEADKQGLLLAEKSYGDSWKRRGGTGSFMMLARKWDRIENQCKGESYDVFEALANYPGDDGLIDDIRDLRRYLVLVECEYLRMYDSKVVDSLCEVASSYTNQDK